MNQARRREIEVVISQLDDIITNEQEAYDNMPESIQESEKGETMEAGLDSLQEAVETLGEVLNP